MNVAQFGERIANGVIDDAFADFPALDVRQRNAQRGRHGGRREHLVPVGGHQQQIGAHLPQAVGQAESRQTDRLGHADIAVRTQEAFDPRVDAETVLLDLPRGAAEFGGKVRSHRDGFQFHSRVRREFA